MEVVLDDERTTDEWIREDTEKKQAMEQWFNDLHEKISAFKSARSNEKRYLLFDFLAVTTDHLPSNK